MWDNREQETFFVFNTEVPISLFVMHMQQFGKCKFFRKQHFNCFHDKILEEQISPTD